GAVWESSPPQAPNVKPAYWVEAARLTVWDASSCTAADRARSVATASAGPMPDGQPLFLVARAAAARARGDQPATEQLLDQAGAANDRKPTYYGAAWVALGQLLLTTDSLVTCPR